MLKALVSFVVFGVVLLTNGCASIVSEKIYPVAIDSSPPGLDFTIRNKRGVNIHSGKTPTSVMLRSGDGYFSSAEYQVVIQQNGRENISTIDSSLDGWYWGNILIGGLIGFLIVDPLTGAMWSLEESHTLIVSDSEVSKDEVYDHSTNAESIDNSDAQTDVESEVKSNISGRKSRKIK